MDKGKRGCPGRTRGISTHCVLILQYRQTDRQTDRQRKRETVVLEVEYEIMMTYLISARRSRSAVCCCSQSQYSLRDHPSDYTQTTHRYNDRTEHVTAVLLDVHQANIQKTHRQTDKHSLSAICLSVRHSLS